MKWMGMGAVFDERQVEVAPLAEGKKGQTVKASFHLPIYEQVAVRIHIGRSPLNPEL